MIQIDRNLPRTHEHNIKAAKVLGLRYDEAHGDWVPKKKKRLVSGNGQNDTRWGQMSDFDQMNAHR